MSLLSTFRHLGNYMYENSMIHTQLYSPFEKAAQLYAKK